MLSTSSSLASQLVFMHDVDEVVVRAIERGSVHGWSHILFKAICKRYGLSVKGARGELVRCVESPYEVHIAPHRFSEKRGDGWCFAYGKIGVQFCIFTSDWAVKNPDQLCKSF